MKYIVYTDGSSRGNPGAAGWASIIMSEEKVKEYADHVEKATNNQMEIYAVLYSMQVLYKVLKTSDKVDIHSDSEYVVKSINSWMSGWVKNNWKNSQKKEVLNKDLWLKVLEIKNKILESGCEINFIHVRGHADNIYNNRADKICTAFATKTEKEIRDLYNGKKEDYNNFLKA